MSFKKKSPTPIVEGGTNRSTQTAYAVICGGTTATGAQQSVAALGASGTVLTSTGASSLPTFQSAGGGGIKVTEYTTAGIRSHTIDADTKYMSVFLVSGGGGGAGGQVGASGSANGGGGGTGSPTSKIEGPVATMGGAGNIVSVNVSAGGAGGAAGANGSQSSQSYWGANQFIASQGVNGESGGPGGNEALRAVNLNMIRPSDITGFIYGAGGNGTVTVGDIGLVVVGIYQPSGGGGGGGGDSSVARSGGNGGRITHTGGLTVIAGGVGAAGDTGTAGSAGNDSNSGGVTYATGGSGGGGGGGGGASTNGGAGGAGGWPGGGGAGGGGAVTGNTAGAGGAGAAGYALIVEWK